MNEGRGIDFECVDGVGEGHAQIELAWQAFVLAQPSVHLEQLWAWGEVRRVDGWQPALLIGRRGGELVAGCLILHRRLHRFFRVGYASRGPLISPAVSDSQALQRSVIRELKDVSRRLGLDCLVIDLPYSTVSGFPDPLQEAGFTTHSPQLPPAGLSNGALVIDLRRSEQQLLQGMRQTLRRNLRQAREGKVGVREGGEGDINLLWRFLTELCLRRGVQSNIRSVEVIRRLWHLLAPAGQARIDVAEVAGQPVVALLTVLLGSWAIPWRIGSSGAAANLHPEKHLLWSVLKSLQAAGFRTFDFNWVNLEEAEAIRKGVAVPPSANSGITFFKMGFGGDLIRLPGAFDYFPNLWVRWGLRLGGARLLRSSIPMRLIRNLAGRRRGGGMPVTAGTVNSGQV